MDLITTVFMNNDDQTGNIISAKDKFSDPLTKNHTIKMPIISAIIKISDQRYHNEYQQKRILETLRVYLTVSFFPTIKVLHFKNVTIHSEYKKIPL